MKLLRPLVLAAVVVLFALPLWFVLAASLHREGTGLGADSLALPADPQWHNTPTRSRAWAASAASSREHAARDGALDPQAVLHLRSPATHLRALVPRPRCPVPVRARGDDAAQADERAAARLLFRTMGLVDTYWPLVLPTVLGGAPFFVFLFRQYFLSLPAELGEAAHRRLHSWQAYWRVFLPLARPMLATVA